ncbi:MAG TPA: N-acetylglucosamine-6-phosphate deacetylase [Vicinamibacterales bacterium]
MIVLSGAEVVLPDRVLSPGTVVVDEGLIVDVKASSAPGGTSNFAFHGHYIVPGFIDVHVHGVEGVDTLSGQMPVADIARRLPKFGVTAFCPTTVACSPSALQGVLDQVRRARETPDSQAARVLPAHLESNFISPEYKGAQPLGCLRNPRAALKGGERAGGAGRAGKAGRAGRTGEDSRDEFDGAEVLAEIERGAPDIGIVTVAPEVEGGLDLIEWLTTRGLRVSLGHSGATYEQAQAAIAAGARHATHLFNRMPPLDHRRPGLVGAILQAEEVAAELICDGTHVHPALVRTAVSAKRPSRMMAITDATAGAGLPIGSQTRLGDQTITVNESVAVLADGTLAGSVLTMDRAFEMLVARVGFSPVEAAVMCATTPARELGLVGHGAIVPGAVADLVVLDAQFAVVQTYVAGRLIYNRRA